MNRTFATVDGNEAVARVAFKTNEVIAIYPITPASPMGEWADEQSAREGTNIFGAVPLIQEMQSEGGAAGAVHGALQAGALTTTFTASQGLLLMLPNMFKIAGELTATVFHVAARSVATHALSIFGDHSDVMAVRTSGFGMLAAASVQEAQDLALIAQMATLEARVPILHFFDGFRTSHEVSKIGLLSDDQIRQAIDLEMVRQHRARRLTPDRPEIRGTAQNPDVFFQSREACNPYYERCPGIVAKAMKRFQELTGRSYQPFHYHGSPEAKRVLVLMGSGVETVRETVDELNQRGEDVGVIQVMLFRPFSVSYFLAALPASVQGIAVLDRTKEPGSAGEPLYQDVVTAIQEDEERETRLRVIGGRYGLASKEFTPSMVSAIFEHLETERPKRHFTIGISDDVGHTSLPYDTGFRINHPGRVQALFYGLGSDGTVGANKNSIKIIGENTDHHAQGYFVYDSKKAGSVTVSHLRFGPQPIQSSYLIEQADFLGCHQFQFLDRIDVLEKLKPEGTFLLNSPFGPEEVWAHLPEAVQRRLRELNARFFVIDAHKLAAEIGLKGRINTIMQTCFFLTTDVMEKELALAEIKESILKTYGKQGDLVVKRNYAAVEGAAKELRAVEIPADAPLSGIPLWEPQAEQEDPFVNQTVLPLIQGRGDQLPVSACPVDGSFPVGTARYEKRNIAAEIPVWEPDICIQCGKCAIVCPHATIRIKAYPQEFLNRKPETFKHSAIRDRDLEELVYTIQVAPEDCTGCGICVEVCPAKSKSEARKKALNMYPQRPLLEPERANWDFFLEIPEIDRSLPRQGLVRQSQLLQPLFEFSGACAGCGETPYLKLATQLFGDRMLVANATGCSSIYGGNLPTTPWSANREGKGPAWSNSLFEDNAEFGLGFRLALDQQLRLAESLLREVEGIGPAVRRAILEAEQSDEADILAQRERVEALKSQLQEIDSNAAQELLEVADAFVKKSVWIVGGDGWAYDIGYGGLDHVLASGQDVNILVLDTQVYSNTGGQMSKATPRAAVAKFAAAGKTTPRKDLALLAMSYENVYVASVAMGARDEHTLRAFLEAESYEGPSLIIAYSHCIAHGINMGLGMQNQRAAVLSGFWPLLRYDPRLVREGKNPMQLDSRKPKMALREFAERENRFRILSRTHPEQAKVLQAQAQEDIQRRWHALSHLSQDSAEN